jgi:hypothetical protein
MWQAQLAAYEKAGEELAKLKAEKQPALKYLVVEGCPPVDQTSQDIPILNEGSDRKITYTVIGFV